MSSTTPSTSKKINAKSASTKTQEVISITDVGAIKVATKKLPKIAKGAPKAKRPKLDDTLTPESLDAEPTDGGEPALEQTFDDGNGDSSELDDDPDDDSALPAPWTNTHFVEDGSKSIITTAFEEIALEGLDGVTLEALWTRIAVSLSITRPISRNLMQFVWNNIRSSENFIAFTLQEPRGRLLLSNDGDFAEDIYPFVRINDKENNILGSCSTYDSRTKVEVAELSLTDAEEMGNRLVLVATQELRTHALINPFVDPHIVDVHNSLALPQYYILERIARSRRQGETTTGPRGLSALVRDAKTLFYYRNQLQDMRLVSKQNHCIKSDNNVSSVGGLIHLQRFYNEVKSQRQLIIEFIIKMIKQKPNYRIEYVELRRVLGSHMWNRFQLSKVVKSQEFKQFVKTDVMYPYRVMYPNATPAEWQRKANPAEKRVRVFELRNPGLNINSIFKEDKEEGDAGESSDSEPEGDNLNGIMTTQRIYQAISATGLKGIKMKSLSYRANCDRYTTRNICKYLTSLGLIEHSMQDLKRQHYIVYIATEYTKDGGAAAAIESAADEIDDDVDNETCDFIANVLKIEPSVLKTKPPSKTLPASTPVSTNVYDTINVLRKVKDNENLNSYFANLHPFAETHLRHLTAAQRKMSAKDKKTKQLFSAFLETCSNAGPRKLVSLYSSPCEYNIQHVNCETASYTPQPAIVRRKLTSFKPFKKLINEKYWSTPFKYASKLQNIRVDDPLSSSDEEPLEDLCSLESIVSGFHGTYPVPNDEVSKNVKTAIIEYFERDDVSGSGLRHRFSVQETPNVPVVTETEPVVDMSEENFFNVHMEIFMGPKPRIISVTKDFQDVEAMLVLSTHPDGFKGWRSMISNSQRVQSRIKIIKDAVYTQKTVIDLIKITSIINQAERAEGYNAHVDRKSLQRIFTTLVREGQFIIIKIILKYQRIIRSKNVIAETTHDIEPLIHSIVDQFKNSFVMYAKRKLFEEEERDSEAPTTVRRRFKYNRFIGRKYGFNPKVSKMRILHEFLFYLMREFTGSPITREEARNVYMNCCDADCIDDVMKESTTLYQREATWRMFVPPLPKHKNHPTGWALICDILLRLPVSLFVKLYNVSFIIPELPSYLNHPVRRHFIVKNMPSHIKDALLGYRKYIFSIHEIICYLAYMGLVQFGPQKMREKDQVFIYLNTKAITFDTTTSECGYHHITPKEYPKYEYDFQTSADVERYWSNVYYYAINTKLGNRNSVIGQSIKLEFVHAKPLLAVTLRSQTIESAAQNDVGYLPGDGLGACCSDSALWLHVLKNWHWCSKPSNSNRTNQHTITGIRRKHLEDVKEIKINEIHPQRKGKRFRMPTTRGTIMTTRLKKTRVKPAPRTANKKVIMRKVKPRKGTKKIRVRVDPLDKKILDKMGKSRAVFDSEEDKLILICMACNDYLTAKNKKRYVSSIAIRDFIHRTLPWSRKTSLAYRRRSVQLRKRSNLEDEKAGFNFKIVVDFFTEKHFGRIRNGITRKPENGAIVSDAHLNLTFVYLANYTWKRYKTSPNLQILNDNDALNDYLKPAMIPKFEAVLDEEDNFCKDPTSNESISLDTIQSVIISSLNAQGNDPQLPFQLLKVYQTFPEDLLRTALLKMRDYQVISGKKVKSGKEGTILMSGITYNLSFAYNFKQITHFPRCIFTEAHELLTALSKHFDRTKRDGISIEKFEHGHSLGTGEFQTKRHINWTFDLPDDIITLNPNLSNFDDLIKELTQRYAELMKKSQETDEGSYEDAVKHLENNLKSFISDQHSAKLAESADSAGDDTDNAMDTQEDPEERALKLVKLTESSSYGKTDRRHKCWRISDMAFMLTKGLFPELDDDDRLDKLNEHFIVRYPTCRLRIDDTLKENDEIFEQWHDDVRDCGPKIVRKVLKDALIHNTLLDPEMLKLSPEAIDVAEFINGCNTLGATSKDIKKQFPGIKLEVLEQLLDTGIVLRVGVCNLFFVHHNYRHNWSICLNNENPPSDKAYGGYLLRISPWIRINGTVNEKVLDNWMTSILSFCLSYPCATFRRLASRFNSIKPVDIYYILEILQMLDCLRIWSYVRDDEGLGYDDFDILPQVPSSMLDDFDDVFVETNASVITKFGAYLNRHKTDFAYVFEEQT